MIAPLARLGLALLLPALSCSEPPHLVCVTGCVDTLVACEADSCTERCIEMDTICGWARSTPEHP